jgi:thiosulfate/3-mercaptopyruvate sulfurtransferase
MITNRAISPLIETAELQALVGSAKVVVIDCRFSLADTEFGYQQYLSGHIPGAFYLHLDKDLSGPISDQGGRHPFPDPADFSRLMADLAIDKNTHVVIYDSSRFAFASRLWWMLKSVGCSPVQVLNGGYPAWLECGGAVDSSAVATSAEGFAGNGDEPLTFDNCLSKDAMLTAQAGGAWLIDAREAERYEGLNEPIDPVAGHIPGAVNVPWQGVTDDSGRARDVNAQKALWQAIGTDEQVVVYCGSGVTACVDLLSLEIAGYTNKKLYIGSWSDWCSYL